MQALLSMYNHHVVFWLSIFLSRVGGMQFLENKFIFPFLLPCFYISLGFQGYAKIDRFRFKKLYLNKK